MGKPAVILSPAPTSGATHGVTGRTRLLLATIVACLAFALLPAAAFATASGLNGAIVEPESTSATACHVVSRDPDGSHPIELLSACPDFSVDEDGNTTAETDFDGTNGIKVLVKGTLQRTITVPNRPTDYGYGNVALSPDGDWVAFELLPSDSSEIASLYVAPTDGSSAPRQLIAYDLSSGDGAISLQPAWTPDSKRLVTFALEGGTTSDIDELVSIDAASGAVSNLAASADIAPTDFHDWVHLSFVVDDVSPDGTRALLSATRYNGYGSEERLWEVDLGASSATRVSNREYDLPQSFDLAAVYSPDGTQIAIHVLDESTNSAFEGEYLVLHPLHDTKAADDDTESILSNAPAGNTGHMVWEIEDTGPDITTGPDDTTTKSRTATFEFGSEVIGVTFQCSLDKAAFTACKSPVTYSSLADGPHTFRVRIVYPDESVSTISERAWTVDNQLPVVLIDSAPSGTGNPADATITFHGNEPDLEFTCSLDGGEPYACSSPVDLFSLTPGSHVLTITATDALGNTSSAPTVVTWSVGGGSNLPPVSTCSGHAVATASSGLLFMVGRSGTCLTRDTVAGQPVWKATGVVTVNGILVTPDHGTAVTLSAAGANGTFTTTGPASFQLGSLLAYHADNGVAWAQDALGLLKSSGLLVQSIAGLKIVPVWPTIDLSSDDGGTARIALTVTLPEGFSTLPSALGGKDTPQVSGALSVTASNDKGVSFGGRVQIAKAFLGSLEVKDIDLAYNSGAQAFSGSFGLELPPDGPEIVVGATIGAPPTPALWGCCLRKLTYAVQNLNRPIGDTPLFLQKLGGEFSRETGTVAGRQQTYLKLAGVAGLSLGPTLPFIDQPAVTFDGTASLSWSDPWVLEASGQASLLQFPLEDGKVTYTSGVGAVLTGHVDETIAGYGLSAQITNTFFAGRSQFNIEGTGLTNWPLLGSQATNVIFSNKGFAACSEMHGRFGDSAYGWGVDSSGHLQVLAGMCDLGPYRVTSAAAHATAAGTPRDVMLAAHSGMRLLAVHGAGGAPNVTVTGPAGLHLVGGPNGTRTATGIVIVDKAHATTYVLLPGGPAGRYTITSSDRTITGVGEADSLPPAHPRVTSRPAPGGRRVLSWSQHTAPGQQLELFEQGAGGTGRLLVTTVRARGHLTYAPQLGIGGKRSILAVTLENGLPRARLVVARYAVVDRPPGKVRGLKAKGRRLRWKAAPRATRYMIAFVLHSRSRAALTTRHLAVRIPAGASAATVLALDALGRPGPAATIRLHRARRTHRAHHRAR